MMSLVLSLGFVIKNVLSALTKLRDHAIDACKCAIVSGRLQVALQVDIPHFDIERLDRMLNVVAFLNVIFVLNMSFCVYKLLYLFSLVESRWKPVLGQIHTMALGTRLNCVKGW